MQPYIVWQDSFSVGDVCLDAEHKQIIDAINDLFAAKEAGQECAVIKSILDRLIHCMFMHIQHEEQVMRDCGYPYFERHKASHDKIRQWMIKLNEQVHMATEHDLLYFLKEWWTSHVQGEDKKYVSYLPQTTSDDEVTPPTIEANLQRADY
jgi:hemerythrin